MYVSHNIMYSFLWLFRSIAFPAHFLDIARSKYMHIRTSFTFCPIPVLFLPYSISLSLSLSFSFHSFCFSFFSPFFLFLYAHLCSTHGLINNAFVTDQQRVDEFLSLRRRVSSLLFFFFFFVLTDTFFPLEFFHSRLLSLRIVGGSSVISRDCR